MMWKISTPRIIKASLSSFCQKIIKIGGNLIDEVLTKNLHIFRHGVQLYNYIKIGNEGKNQKIEQVINDNDNGRY